MTTLTIMQALPREVDPVVYNMLHDNPGNVSYSVVGGLSDQIWELRESIELPLMNFELFMHVGIKPPKERHCWLEQLPATLMQTSSRWFLVQVSFGKCLGMHVITRYIFLNSPFFLHAVLSLSTTFPSAQTSWRVLFRFTKVVAIWLRSCCTCLVGELHFHG
jgi:hypothetical protein